MAINSGDKVAINSKKYQKEIIISYAIKKEEFKTSDIGLLLGIKASRARMLISELVKEGLLESVGENRNRKYKVSGVAINSGDKVAINSGDKVAINSKKYQKEIIISYAIKKEEFKTSDIGLLLGIKASRARILISELVKEGLLESIGENRNRKYKVSKMLL